MTENFILVLFITFLLLDFVVERILSLLNIKNNRKPIPTEFESYFNKEHLDKSVQYENSKLKLSIISSGFSLLIIISVLLVGGFGMVDNFLRLHLQNPILLSLAFFGILAFAAEILSFPIDYIFVFTIEEKFGFNKMNVRTFLSDKLKSYAISIVFGGGIIALITWFYTISPEKFWLIAWFLVTFLMVFFMVFYSQLIVPLFNKQTPLEAGELRAEIENFASKAGFSLKNIFVIDGSKRSAKSNAYFTGLGSRKRIVLYDTLIKEHSKEELVAVLAHEIGHYKKNHIIKSVVVSLLQNAALFYLLALFLNPENQISVLAASALGAKTSFHIGILCFALFFGPFSMILGILSNYFSRKNEYEADNYAKKMYDAEFLISALLKLSKNNLSKLNPHPWYVFVNYSHPALFQRIRNLQKAV